MKEMIKKYRGSLICSVLVMLIGVLVGFTSAQSMWANVFFVVTDCALVAIIFYDNRNRQQSRKLKYIAFLSMLIDHTNKALIYPNLDGGALNAENNFFSAFPTTIFFPLTPSHLFSDRFPLSLRHFPHLQLIFFHLCS